MDDHLIVGGITSLQQTMKSVLGVILLAGRQIPAPDCHSQGQYKGIVIRQEADI